MLKSPPFIVLPLSSTSSPFCHGIASPHSFLDVFDLVQLCLEMVQEKGESRHLSS